MQTEKLQWDETTEQASNRHIIVEPKL
jgi:hypothetical protein